ncbi:aminopeptidase n, partial [Lasius niger]
MQDAHNAIEIPNVKKFDVKEMMNAWTKQKHYPILRLIAQPDSEYVRILVENINKLGEDNWFIPITVTKQEDPNFKIYTTWRYYWETQFLQDFSPYVELSIPRKEDEWIIVNLQQVGYCRVNYEPENWRNIARYLNSANYTKIHVLNRAQIIDDAFYFLSTRQLNLYIFLELTEYLSQETDYVAWYPMIKALEHMSSSFPIIDEDVDLIKKSMLEILNGVLEKIGYEERTEENDLTKCLRQEVAKWACILEHPKCIQMARDKLERHLIHLEKLSPWWKEWTYCKGIMAEENLNGIWKVALEKWASNSDNRILEFLTCIAHPNSIKEYLKKEGSPVFVSLENLFLKLQNIDRVNIFLFIIMKHAKNNEILEYVLKNIEELKP